MAEWQASEHRSAWSDPVFQSGYAVDRQPECRQCHAPLNAEPRDPLPSSVAARNGVSCRSCHAAQGHIAGPGSGRAHGGPVAAEWGTSTACRGCHEFDFPRPTPERRAVFDPREPMQRTVSEWAQSGTDSTCQDCHMPWRIGEDGGRYRSHRMRGIDDAEFMASAVQVQLRAKIVGDETVVEAEVHAETLGHAFPTGDMFRVAELAVWPVGQSEQAKGLEMRREFGTVARLDDEGVMQAWGAEVRDTRPRPGRPVRRTLRFAGAHPELSWSLVHRRMPTEQARSQGLVEVNERAIAHGRVSATSE